MVRNNTFRRLPSNPVFNAQTAATISDLHRLSNRPRHNNSNNRSSNQHRHFLPSLSSIGTDAVDHINFSNNAQSQLGKVLAFENSLDVVLPYAGHFSSLNHFWYFLKSPSHDDRFRNVKPPKVRMKLRGMLTEEMNSNTEEEKPVPNFKALIAFGMYHRIISIPALTNGVKEINLPFDLYTVNDGVCVRPAPASWLVPIMEIIREALVETKEPNFFEFLDADVRKAYKEAEMDQTTYTNKVIENYFISEGIYKPKKPKEQTQPVNTEATNSSIEEVEEEVAATVQTTNTANEVVIQEDPNKIKTDSQDDAAFAGGGSSGSWIASPVPVEVASAVAAEPTPSSAYSLPPAVTISTEPVDTSTESVSIETVTTE